MTVLLWPHIGTHIRIGDYGETIASVKNYLLSEEAI